MPNPRQLDTADNPDTTVVVWAAEALHLAAAGTWERAYYKVQTCADIHPDRLRLMVATWCDAYAEHATDGRAADGWMPTAIDDMPGLPARMRWAAGLVIARTQRDSGAFTRLWDARPDDRHRLGEYVATVLEVVATTFAMSPRGFAVRKVQHQ